MVQLDDAGYVLVGGDVDGDALSDRGRRPLPLETSLPGLFAIGDVRGGSVKRVATAVGDGATVVQLIHQCLEESQAMAPRPGG